MKKCLFLLLLLVSLSMLLASESSPSETVGYYKIGTVQEDGSIIPITPGRFTPVSVPFGLTLKGAWEVFGNQFGYEDNIVDPYNGWGGTYYGEWGWFYNQTEAIDSLMMMPGHIYWIERNSNNESFNFYLTGKVDPQPFTLTMRGQAGGGWTPFALNESVPVSVYNLGIPNLIGDWENNMFDMIVDVTDGSGATYYGEYGWFDALSNNDYMIKPTHAYYFFSNYDDPDEGNLFDSFSWTYTPQAARNNSIINNTKLPIRSKR